MLEKINFDNIRYFSVDQKNAVNDFINSVDINTLCYIVQTVLSEHSDTVADYLYFNSHRYIKSVGIYFEDKE